MSSHLLNMPEDPALSLTAALISSSPIPLLLLDGELCIVAASMSFCDAFAIDPATALGGKLYTLGSGEWDIPQLRFLLGQVAAGTPQLVAAEMELERPDLETRCLIVNATAIVYLDLAHPRLLVAVADITEARASERAKDEVTERLKLQLLEVRHRIANSLQIISSILLKTARRTGSTEIRDGLTDAHNRVMSIAALERQLSMSVESNHEVEISTYFSSLCESIAASMISDRQLIALVVTGGGLVTPRVSVSLGLIVTELVINALKHAFPEGSTGQIEISYEARGPNWTLRVADDGVGMPKDRGVVRCGLGTSVVEALARQLQATVEITPSAPGTVVCVEHIQVAAIVDGKETTRVAHAPDGVRTRHPRTVSGR